MKNGQILSIEQQYKNEIDALINQNEYCKNMIAVPSIEKWESKEYNDVISLNNTRIQEIESILKTIKN